VGSYGGGVLGAAGDRLLTVVRVPQSYIQAGFASPTVRNTGGSARRIPVPPDHLFSRQVTVDLGNDGIAYQVTFTAAGTATASVGPSGGGDVWSLDQVSVSTSVGQLDASQCTVYVGPQPLAQYQIAPTLSGGGQQFGMGGAGLGYGWFVWALWTGGTSGAFAFLRVTGNKTVLSN
jgi:hypothetical protein